MKRLVLASLLCLLASAPLRAQLPAPAAATPPPFITLDAVMSGSRSEQQSHWESGYGSYDRSTLTGSKVDVTVRNGGRTPCQVSIVTLFIAHPLNGGAETRTICGADEKLVTLDGSRDTKYSVASPEISLRDQNYAAIRERDLQGKKIEGWIVKVYDHASHKTVAMKASSAPLEALASDKDKLVVMAADYKRAHAPGSARIQGVDGQVATIFGPVVSVETNGEPMGLLIGAVPQKGKDAPQAMGTVFLRFHPDQARALRGTMIQCSGKQAGTFWYHDASGEKRTVPSYDFVAAH